MVRCDECRYWGNLSDDRRRVFGQCKKNVATIHNFSVVIRTKGIAPEWELFTRDDFGCVNGQSAVYDYDRP